MFTRSGEVWSQQGEKMVGDCTSECAGGGRGIREVGEGVFGHSVALSAEGDTALVGAPKDGGYTGAVWVFTRSAAGWGQEGEKLLGTDDSPGAGFANRVAMSADGNTIVVGGPDDEQGIGAAWIFTRVDGIWSQQGEKLVADCQAFCRPNEGTGEVGDGLFGQSVAISGDGNTVILGAPFDNVYSVGGAAWVFTRSNGVWMQLGAKITGDCKGPCGYFGKSVAISADGNTALVGAPQFGRGEGAVWAFTRSGGAWSAIGQQLLGFLCPEARYCGSFGESLALSADGNTALVGEPSGDRSAGNVWVFARSGASWRALTTLDGAGEIGEGYFGESVALSAEGNTALVGGGHDDEYTGAAWIFTRSGESWSQQGEKLTHGSAHCFCFFGSSVALSADGNTALVGAPSEHGFAGAGWIFTRVDGKWNKEDEELTGGCANACTGGEGTGEIGAGNFGGSVALSSDGDTLLLGAPGDSRGAGAAWVFVRPPIIAKIEPHEGLTKGGTTVAISGANLADATEVRFGGTRAPILSDTATEITAVSPPAKAGTVDVTVTTSGGTSEPSTADRFAYDPIERFELVNWTLAGALTDRKLREAIGLPSGSLLSASGELNTETGSGSLVGAVQIPGSNVRVHVGSLPIGLDVELAPAGALDGVLQASSARPGEEDLTLTTGLSIAVTSVQVLGLTFATSCETAGPISLVLEKTLALPTLEAAGAQFAGTTSLPRLTCSGGLAAGLLGPILSALLSGPENAYQITIAPPSG